MTVHPEYRWDERSAQPEQLGNRRTNFISGLRDAFPMLKSVFTNLVHTLPLLMRYRYYRKRVFRKQVKTTSIGCAVTYDRENKEKLIETYKASGAGSLLIRVLSWQEDLYREIAEFAASFGLDREQVLIVPIQDREAVENMDLWIDRFSRIRDLFRDTAAYFQIGHVPNRKKWGFWTPQEYTAFFRKTALLKTDGIRFVGPSSIDFELVYTDAILARLDSELFDVYNSLLYVDRRGNPENPQWPSFETMNKIRITKALGDINGLTNQPFWITEVNWPIIDTGSYSPAARALGVSEKLCADYLVRYYVLAFSTGLVDRIFWWELSAHGYGLIDPFKGVFRERPSYAAFSTVASHLPGTVNRDFYSDGTRYICCFQKSSDTLFAAWQVEGESEVRLTEKPQVIYHIDNTAIKAASSVTLFGSPVFLYFEGKRTIEEIFDI